MQTKSLLSTQLLCGTALALLLPLPLFAACVDNVVLVHGNAGAPSDFDNTYNTLLARGYSTGQILRPATRAAMSPRWWPMCWR